MTLFLFLSILLRDLPQEKNPRALCKGKSSYFNLFLLCGVGGNIPYNLKVIEIFQIMQVLFFIFVDCKMNVITSFIEDSRKSMI
jgi:hypothetical protein